MLQLTAPRGLFNAFSVSIKKWVELPDHIKELCKLKDKSPRWPCTETCAMCHFAGVGDTGIKCRDSNCVLKGAGACGRKDDIYDIATKALRAGKKTKFRAACLAMVCALQKAYIEHLEADLE